MNERRLKRGMIELLCNACGQRRLTLRADWDPDRAVLLVTSHCNRCDRGDFGLSRYYDAAGREVAVA